MLSPSVSMLSSRRQMREEGSRVGLCLRQSWPLHNELRHVLLDLTEFIWSAKDALLRQRANMFFGMMVPRWVGRMVLLRLSISIYTEEL